MGLLSLGTKFIEHIKNHRLSSIIFFVVIVGLIGFYVLLHTSDNTVVATVKQEDLVNTVLVNGTYTIASQTQVTSPTNGIITNLYIENEDQVKKGDPLFHVESSATPDQQKAAYAAYLAATSQLKADTAELYSLQSTMFAAWKVYTDLSTNSTYEEDNGDPKTENRILPEFTTAQDDWLAAEANYKNQQAVIAKDNASVASTKQEYDETQSVTVTAPLSGKVINLAAKVSDQVAVKEPGIPVLMLANFSNPRIVSAVDQANIPRLRVGQKTTIIFDALPDQAFTGKVSSIDTAGVKTQGTTNFNVYVTATHLPITVRPNMTASITIETARKDHVLTIPNGAIIKKDRKIFVQRAGKSNNDLTEVKLGLKGLTKTEVISGLSVGDHVVEQQ